MKKRILVICILSLLFSSCGLFYKAGYENGKKYYIDKKGQKFYFEKINPNTKYSFKKSKR